MLKASLKQFSVSFNSHKYSKLKYFFAKQKKIPIPYIFGGLPNQQFYHHDQAKQFLDTMFFSSVQNTLTQRYRNFLVALQEKNVGYLKQNVSNNLIKNLDENFPEVSLINKEAPIKVAILNNFIVNGIGFERQQYDKYMTSKKMPFKAKNTVEFYEGKSLIKSQENERISLFVSRVYFKSAMKLIKKTESSNSANPISEKARHHQEKEQNKQEVHLIQFEVQNIVNIRKMAIKGFVTRLLNLRNKQKFKQDMFRFSIGGSPIASWKIGDVDKILHGNLPTIISQEEFKSKTEQLNTNKSK